MDPQVMKKKPNKQTRMAKYINATPLLSNEKEELIDAYEAIEKTPGAWEWLKRPDVPGDDGFMFSDDVMMILIKNNMKHLYRHSGGSFAHTMRTMEMIAKHGWRPFMTSFKLTPACPCRLAQGEVTGWCGVAGVGVPGCQH